MRYWRWFCLNLGCIARRGCAVVGVGLVLSGGGAAADEVWETDQGRVVYLDDVGDVAVWELVRADGVGRMYIPGLAGNFDNRGVHTGYWIADTGGGCGAVLMGVDGFRGTQWGQLRVVFHDSGFPTDWTITLGRCFEDPEISLRGRSPNKR